MSNVAIELSPAELELIEAKRAEQDARDLVQRAREERDHLAQQHKKAARQSMVDALLDADEDGILFTNTEVEGAVYFMLNRYEQDIRIEEHRGMKYYMSGGYNNYNQRYYTNPKSVIKKIKEFQEADEAKRKREQTKKSLSEQALELAIETYPECEVTLNEGYDSRYGRYKQKGNYQPDVIKVVGKGGHYEFTFHGTKERDVELTVWKRSINKELDAEVRKMVLG